MSVRIHISKKDIENGRQCEGAACAMALAVKRRLKSSSEVCVFSRSVLIGKTWFPHTGYEFVKKFDRSLKEDIKPTKITIQGLDKLP